MTAADALRPRALVVDDQPPFRRAAKALLEGMHCFSIVVGVGTGEAGLEVASRLSMDLVILDVRLPGMDGVETTRELLRLDPLMVIMLVSTYSAHDLPHDLDSCGAAVFLQKEDLTSAAILEQLESCRSFYQ